MSPPFPNTLTGIFYGPRGGNQDQIAAVMRAVAATFPGSALTAMIDEEGRPIPLENSERWAYDQLVRTGGALVCTPTTEHFAAMTARFIEHVRQPAFQLVLRAPDWVATPPCLFDFVRDVGDLFATYWAHLTPAAASGKISCLHGQDEVDPLGLPRLEFETERPEAPLVIGWMAYFGPAARGILGLALDDALEGTFARSERTPTGALVAQLTHEPLDLERADHLEALKRAYAALPRIGHPPRTGQVTR